MCIFLPINEYKATFQRNISDNKFQLGFVLATDYLSDIKMINRYINNDWTLPDSLIIALILKKIVNEVTDPLNFFIYLSHEKGCKYGRFLNSYLRLDFKTILNSIEGLSYIVMPLNKKAKVVSYTCKYKLDKTIWTKEYKKNFIIMLKLANII